MKFNLDATLGFAEITEGTQRTPRDRTPDYYSVRHALRTRTLKQSATVISDLKGKHHLPETIQIIETGEKRVKELGYLTDEKSIFEGKHVTWVPMSKGEKDAGVRKSNKQAETKQDNAQAVTERISEGVRLREEVELGPSSALSVVTSVDDNNINQARALQQLELAQRLMASHLGSEMGDMGEE
jgi:hypothetical protein